MAELPSADVAAAAVQSTTPTSDAVTSESETELRVANVQADGPEALPFQGGIVEAPEPSSDLGTMRGAAIAKVMADKVRKPKVANVDCNGPFCKPKETQSTDGGATETATDGTTETETATAA